MSLDNTIHERGVRLRLDATATRPPGRSRTWTVEAGRWRAEGATEKAAIDALTERLQEFLKQYQDPKVLSFRGYTAVVTLDLGDGDNPVTWSERVVDPHGRVAYSGFAANSWQEAEARARYVLARRSTDWHDDNSVHEAAAYIEDGPRFVGDRFGPAEIYRYASWQRAARVAMDAGRDDWHEWATKHVAEFTVPRPAEPAGTPHQFRSLHS
jgi:hypothetical protein